MDENEVRDQVRELVRRHAPQPEADLTADDVLAEKLGYDSLALIELALGIQVRFGIDAGGDSGATNVVTVGDIEQMVCDALRTNKP
ncbi:acyl carrier protein [Nocardia vermiculata]|uniref:Acyl carrier protein n=1 Tax=Nocardia vermiculata TaxID=257274 RepID=A0A846XSI4_9NOCA|nr:acyl carrier protein [Nocardia vermiculata]NKY48744.1 acyl carrier protein [Nocardia vermiculata]